MLGHMPAKKLLQDARGVAVYEVNGNEVRKTYVAFSGGDNWEHNPELPKNEIWIEGGKTPEDVRGLLLHEIVEAKLMEQLDLDYDEAHLIANCCEGFYRQTKDLDAVLTTLKGATGLRQDDVDLIGDVIEPAKAKKAAFDDAPWMTAGRETPEKPAVDDTYVNYLKATLGADPSRTRFFDAAGGTRYPGVTGALGATGRSLAVGQDLLSSGVNPVGKGTSAGFADAFKRYFGDRNNVANMFGSHLSTSEALATLGPMGILTAMRDAKDPTLWAKAFGTAAKTPTEQLQAKRKLQAAMSLHASGGALKEMWNTSPLGDALGKTPLNAILQHPRIMPPGGLGRTVGPEGWQRATPDASSIPVLDPKYFTDNEEAARVAAKYGSFDKYARDLNGDWPVAKDPNDKEEHLYHTVKQDGKVVGMVKVRPHIDGFQISNLWIRPTNRSSGVGTTLMKRVLKHYGDKKLYLTAEIFDNSPLTQGELESWYKKFGFVGTHEGKMSRPADAKTAAEVPAWAKKNKKLLKAMAAKLKKTAGGKETAALNADAAASVMLELLGYKPEKKRPSSKSKPKRTPDIRDALRKKHAAEKVAIGNLLRGLGHAASVIGRGVSMAGRQATPQLSNFRSAYAGAPNPAKSVWDVLSGKAKSDLAWRQSYLNKLQHGIPKDVRKAEGALTALKRTRDPRVRQHILSNLNKHRVDLENQKYLASGMAMTQKSQLGHFSQLDPRLQRYAHPGVPGVEAPRFTHHVEAQWAPKPKPKPVAQARTQALPIVSAT